MSEVQVEEGIARPPTALALNRASATLSEEPSFPIEITNPWLEADGKGGFVFFLAGMRRGASTLLSLLTTSVSKDRVQTSLLTYTIWIPLKIEN